MEATSADSTAFWVTCERNYEVTESRAQHIWIINCRAQNSSTAFWVTCGRIGNANSSAQRMWFYKLNAAGHTAALPSG